MSLAEELNELAIFRRFCSAANLSRLSIVGADIFYCMSRMAQILGLEPLGPHEVGAAA